MANKPLDIHPAALRDLESAIAWYLERSEPAAHNFVAEVDHAIELIVDSPARWPRGGHSTRKFVLQRFPYALIYRERETDIQLLAVAHGNRKPGYWKNRR
jgi:plasmid stabilization system protein ParE